MLRLHKYLLSSKPASVNKELNLLQILVKPLLFLALTFGLGFGFGLSLLFGFGNGLGFGLGFGFGSTSAKQVP